MELVLPNIIPQITQNIKEGPMEYLKSFLVRNLHFLVLALLIIYACYAKFNGMLPWNNFFHFVTYYLPAIGMLSVISGQIDLLLSMDQGGLVNLKARVYDFIHWLMLIGINIGVWLVGGVTLWWFILKLFLLTIIGWQIGIGIKRQLELKVSERIAGVITAIVVFSFGLIAGYIRTINQEPFGWGWIFESSTAIVATLIVIKWIWHDIQTISIKAKGYPRMFFLKGIFNNFLVLLFWMHVMTKGGGFGFDHLANNLGLSFNVLIGNIIYLIYYLIYEYHRKIQT